MRPVLTKCPTCGSKKIKVVRTDYRTRLGDRDIVVPKLERSECPTCGEVLFDCAAMERLEALRPKRSRRVARVVR